MALHEIPAEVLRDLLRNVEGEISPASPYAFLLSDAGDASPEGHRAWLKEHGLLDAPPEQDGRLAVLPSLRRALDIVARPVRRIIVAEVDPEGMRRSVHVSDGAEAVVAMFDEQHCVLSDPLDLKAFRAGLIKIIGAATAKSAPKPIQLHPAVLRLLGVIQAARGEIGEKPSVDGKTAQDASLPLPRAVCAARLGTLLDDPEAGDDLLQRMLDDRILKSTDGSIDIHPSFKPWHTAIASGHVLEIQRMEIPAGQLAEAQPLARAYFLGPAGKRCLVWPVGDETDEVLLSRPTAKQLQGFVGYLIGYADLD